MTKRSLVLAAVVCTVAIPAAAQSIGAPCGGLRVATNSSTQFGQQGVWLQYTVTSSIAPNLCIAQTYVDVVVASVEGSAGHNQATWTASVQRQVPVPLPNLYVTNGRHSYRMTATLTPINALASPSAAVIQLYSPPTPDPVAECAANGSDWYWNGAECVFTPGSPLLIDVGGKGFKLTSLEDSVRFDIDGDGVREQVSWTARDADNAFLACDPNGNGVIDDGTELFGTATRSWTAGPQRTSSRSSATTRWAASSTVMRWSARPIRSTRDCCCGQIAITTASLNLTSLRCSPAPESASFGSTYRAIGRRDQYGNTFRQAAKLTWSNGQQSSIYDVWFRQAR